MGWKESLDKYLTTPPDDGFDQWCESTVDAVSDAYYHSHEEWFEHNESDVLFNELFKQGLSPTEAAVIIESTPRKTTTNE